MLEIWCINTCLRIERSIVLGRKSYEFLNKVKEDNNVDRLYSWSRYKIYRDDPYSYYLRYIQRAKETRHSIYGVSGNVCHDILEGYYKGEVDYDDMEGLYQEKLLGMTLAGLKYNRSDEDKNNNIADNYEESISLFFKEHIPIKSIDNKFMCEEFVTIWVGKYLFQGYIDFIYKNEDGKYVIADWKTSTIYRGKKIDAEKGQLVLYAESLIQKGIDIDDIVIGWNFLKYCTVEYELFSKDRKTGKMKVKETHVMRNEKITKAIYNNIKSRLTKLGYSELEAEDYAQRAKEVNSFDVLPDEIKGYYKVKDCFVDIPLRQEDIDDLKHDIIQTLDKLESTELEYKESKDDRLFWTEVDASNSYFFAHICGYSPEQHKPYKEYLDNLNEERGVYKKPEKQVNNDLSWIDELDWLS